MTKVGWGWGDNERSVTYLTKILQRSAQKNLNQAAVESHVSLIIYYKMYQKESQFLNYCENR